MRYHLRIEKKALRQLKKGDKQISELILKWLYKNIDNSENPRIHGKALVGDKKGLWRYRVGNYRIICQIKDEELVVLAVEVGHRKDIYK